MNREGYICTNKAQRNAKWNSKAYCPLWGGDRYKVGVEGNLGKKEEGAFLSATLDLTPGCPQVSWLTGHLMECCSGLSPLSSGAWQPFNMVLH